MFKHLSVSRTVTRLRILPRPIASFSTAEAVPPNENEGVPPPRPKKRGGFFAKLIGATIIGVGGTATACYLDKDVKEYLETSVPYFKVTEDYVMEALTSIGILGDEDGQNATMAQRAHKELPGSMRKAPMIIRPDEAQDRKSMPLPPIIVDPKDPINFSASTDHRTKQIADTKDPLSISVSTDEKTLQIFEDSIRKEEKEKEKKEKKDKDKKEKKDKDKDKKEKKDKDKKEKKDKKKDKDDDEDKEKKKLEKQEKKEAKKKKKLEKLLKEKEEEEERLRIETNMRRKALIGDISARALILNGVIQNAITAQVNLETKIRQHTSQLKKTLDGDGDSKTEDSSWKAVSVAHDARLQALSDAAISLSKATEAINAQRNLMSEAKEDPLIISDKSYLKAQEELIQREYDLNVAKENARKAETESSSVMIYKELIEKGKTNFMKEVENIKVERKSPQGDGKLSEDEWNFLVSHAYKRVEQLLKRIVELELGQKAMVDNAITFQRISDEELAEERIKNELEHQRREFDLSKQKWDASAKQKYDIELREALARQAAAHSDHLVHVLRVQREEQNRHFELETREKIVKERESFQAAVEKWISRVKGLEIAVENRAQLERQGQLAQKLWLACQNFSDSISSNKMDGTTPLKERMEAITKASESDPTLQRMMSEVSSLAEDRGVFTIEALRTRFRRVKTVCKRVAMLDETGGTLMQLALSWLQSLLIFERTHIYGPDEELAEQDSFTLLSNAEECVRNGDLETALKFMAQLRGLSRVVANDWINECRLTLEAKLVADAMIAFAGDRSARAILKEDEKA